MSHTVASTTDQFKQSFREEARDILVDLESALLELNENHDDTELIGRVFRGLHTIKGSGAMFGFEDLVAFTHHLETAFDRVRSGQLEIGGVLIDLTLAALDQIRAMLEENGESVRQESSARSAILSEVQRLAGIQQNEASEPALPDQQPAASAQGEEIKQWRIYFAPGPDMMLCGANPLLLIRELGQLGTLSIRADLTGIPSLEQLNPERCYVAWEMELATSKGPEAIQDIFIFVDGNCELSIEPAVIADRSPSDSAPRSARNARSSSHEEPRATSGGRRDYDKVDTATSLRVPAEKLDQLVNLVGELVTVQARLNEVATRSGDADITAVAEQIERLTSLLRDSSMNIRMLPIRSTFEKFRRLIHDLARDLGKDVELTMDGTDTELDKTVIEQLSDPLMHLIRNSMDHGIESPEIRASRGKRPTANIHLSARHSGASVLVTVSDDGNGIDTTAVRKRAVEKHLISADASLTEAETFGLIFQPGFSTAAVVTDVSGRGVGMDVVRQRIDALRGGIDVDSKPQLGTKVTLRLPLTLAIIDGLLVSVAQAFFVLPLANTLECIELTREDVKCANGKHVVNVRGELIPYIRLRQQFNIASTPPAIEQVMVVETAEGRFGFVVDQVLGNCQAVTKSLGKFYRHVPAVSGATILGNGTVALILDLERLAQSAVRDTAHAPRGQPPANAK